MFGSIYDMVVKAPTNIKYEDVVEDVAEDEVQEASTNDDGMLKELEIYTVKVEGHAARTLALRLGVSINAVRPYAGTVQVSIRKAFTNDTYSIRLFHSDKSHVDCLAVLSTDEEDGSIYARTFYPHGKRDYFNTFASLDEAIKDSPMTLTDLVVLHFTAVRGNFGYDIVTKATSPSTPEDNDASN